MKAVDTFQRVEKKYFMSEEQCNAFLKETEKWIVADEYGLHTIHNIYYDTQDFGLIRNSLERPRYKEKFRVRGYGQIKEDSAIFLEIKKKYAGVVYKRRTALSTTQARAYLEEGIFPERGDQIMREIDYFMKFYRPEPKLYLAYDRRAYVGRNEPQLRITIDRNIRRRYHRLELGYDGECSFIEPGGFLMEIKVLASYPIWLAKILCDLQIYPVSYSKYGKVYQTSVLAGELELGMGVESSVGDEEIKETPRAGYLK